MKLLAIECAGQACSIALYVDGDTEQRYQQAAAQEHSRLLLPMQDALLQQAGLQLADLDAIVCGHGPGSFTGVRIAVAITQGLAFGAGIPALGVSSLDAIAWGAAREFGNTQILVAVDARMQEIYWGHYSATESGFQSLQPEALAGPGQLPDLTLNDCLAVGSGWSQYADQLGSLKQACVATESEYPQQAADIAGYAAQQITAGLAQPYAASELQPLYLRNKVTG